MLTILLLFVAVLLLIYFYRTHRCFIINIKKLEDELATERRVKEFAINFAKNHS